MRILGGFDEYIGPRIEVTIIGTCRDYNVASLIDTGFSGSLAVPLHVIAKIGAEKIAVGAVTLADGSTQIIPIFSGKIKIGIDEFEIPILVTGDEVLLGMELLSKYEFHGKPATGEFYMDTEPSVKKLTESLKKMRVA